MSTEPSGTPEPRAPEDTAREDVLDERLPTAEPSIADSTVGTGSVFAIGCVVLALVVIFVGLAVFFIR